MERTTLEIIAASVEEAVEDGMNQLGVSRDMLEVEVLDEGSKGFLGLGGRQVRVLLTLKGDEDDVDEQAPKKVSSYSKHDNAQDDSDELIDYAERVTYELISRMKVQGRISAHYGEVDSHGDKPVLIDINGNDLGVLIGRRAETLSAFQYIIGLILSKEAGRFVHVVVDVEGYRSRREGQLRQLAERMAEQAIKTGKRQILEPMSAAERRIVHMALQDHAEVISESIGEDPNRKVTVSPKNL